ncbi:MAG: hypothetical protein B7X91_08165 [Hydrogenophilales bacterium 17-64-11]|nr:MAG: hypothetical protein B7X91_08165 [Hydrogenophilales bacterium 17-64-11]
MKKNQAIRSLSLLTFGWLVFAAPAYAETPLASPQEWGIYASLAGTTWRGGNRQGDNFGTNWRITVEWREVGVALIERWESTDNQYRPMTHVITRGDRPGELRLAATNGVCANRTGTVRPDGSVLFVCNGFFKWPMHVVAPRDGVWEQHYVDLKDSEVAGIKDIWRFQSQSGAKLNDPRVASAAAQASSRGATDAPAAPAGTSASGGPAKKTEEASQGQEPDPAAAAAEPASPLAADWGVYASIVGKDWRGASNVSIRWTKPGEELVETWTYGAERGDYAGQQQLVATIRRGEKPGSLVLSLDREVAGTRTLTGKIRADGSIQLLKPGLILDQRLYTMSLPSPSRLEHFLVPPGNTMLTTLYLAGSDDATRGGRQRPGETWGAYADLAGKHWRLVDDRFKRLMSFGWIVPGDAMYVRTHNLADDRVEIHHVARSPGTGKLNAEPSLWGSWKADVTLDGDRSITLETKGIFGWRMSFARTADGGFEYSDGAYTGSMVMVSGDEVPRLVAEAKETKAQREREARQRKRERQEAFNTALTVVNSALVATNETLRQQAEADRQRLQRERERAAEALRQRAAAEERQRAADMERARQLQAQQDIERQQRVQQQTGQPQQGVQRNAGAQQMAQQQQQQQRRAEETRRREAAEAERKRQQDADTERRRREEAAQRQRADEAMLARSKQLEEALKQQEEEARNRPVAYREGITLCAPPQNGGKAWLCRGPLQNVSGVLDTQSGNVAVRQACGGNNVRDLGMVAGYRAYGCGFGIHPTDREYPGNRDIPASLGVNHIPDRGTFYCNPSTVFAYCKDR